MSTISDFFRQKSEPSLTRDARKLSALLLGLDDVGRARSGATIASIINGIRNLGAMPPAVVDVLWSLLCTVARKAIMGADSDKMMTEIQAGLAPEIHAMIVEKAKAPEDSDVVLWELVKEIRDNRERIDDRTFWFGDWTHRANQALKRIGA